MSRGCLHFSELKGGESHHSMTVYFLHLRTCRSAGPGTVIWCRTDGMFKKVQQSDGDPLLIGQPLKPSGGQHWAVHTWDTQHHHVHHEARNPAGQHLQTSSGLLAGRHAGRVHIQQDIPPLLHAGRAESDVKSPSLRMPEEQKVTLNLPPSCLPEEQKVTLIPLLLACRKSRK